MKHRLLENRSAPPSTTRKKTTTRNTHGQPKDLIPGAGCRKNSGCRVQGERFLLTSPFIGRLKRLRKSVVARPGRAGLSAPPQSAPQHIQRFVVRVSEGGAGSPPSEALNSVFPQPVKPSLVSPHCGTAKSH